MYIIDPRNSHAIRAVRRCQKPGPKWLPQSWRKARQERAGVLVEEYRYWGEIIVDTFALIHWRKALEAHGLSPEQIQTSATAEFYRFRRLVSCEVAISRAAAVGDPEESDRLRAQLIEDLRPPLEAAIARYSNTDQAITA